MCCPGKKYVQTAKRKIVLGGMQVKRRIEKWDKGIDPSRENAEIYAINTPYQTWEKLNYKRRMFSHASWYGEWFIFRTEKLLGENGPTEIEKVPSPVEVIRQNCNKSNMIFETKKHFHMIPISVVACNKDHRLLGIDVDTTKLINSIKSEENNQRFLRS